MSIDAGASTMAWRSASRRSADETMAPVALTEAAMVDADGACAVSRK